MQCSLIRQVASNYCLCIGVICVLTLSGCMPDEYGDKACFGATDSVRIQWSQHHVEKIFDSHGFRVMTKDIRDAMVFDVVYVPVDCSANTHCGRYFVVRWDAGRNVIVLAYSQSAPLERREKVVFEAISTKIIETGKVFLVSPDHCGLRLVNGRYAF